MAGLIEYAMGPKRPHKPNEGVTNALRQAAVSVLGDGATVRITSGKGQHGSPRHREGHAADVQFIDPNGQMITLDDPRARSIADSAAKFGITGLGAGKEYMGGSTFHMDMFPLDQYTPKMGQRWGSWAKGGKAPASQPTTAQTTLLDSAMGQAQQGSNQAPPTMLDLAQSTGMLAQNPIHRVQAPQAGFQVMRGKDGLDKFLMT